MHFPCRCYRPGEDAKRDGSGVHAGQVYYSTHYGDRAVPRQHNNSCEGEHAFGTGGSKGSHRLLLLLSHLAASSLGHPDNIKLLKARHTPRSCRPLCDAPPRKDQIPPKPKRKQASECCVFVPRSLVIVQPYELVQYIRRSSAGRWLVIC